jgi:hypothetical protein
MQDIPYLQIAVVASKSEAGALRHTLQVAAGA